VASRGCDFAPPPSDTELWRRGNSRARLRGSRRSALPAGGGWRGRSDDEVGWPGGGASVTFAERTEEARQAEERGRSSARWRGERRESEVHLRSPETGVQGKGPVWPGF
jgi:hypothetical protein